MALSVGFRLGPGRPRVPDALLILGTCHRRRDDLSSFWRDQMRFERIGGYAVTAKIGEGGWAKSIKHEIPLDRDVALKVPPHAFTDHFDRLAK